MGEIKDNKYYDLYYRDSVEYSKHYKDSVYYELWKKVMPLIGKQPILEIGCGSGQFAEMLADNGITNYIGFDFSEEAVGIAKSKSAQKFFVQDALSPESYSRQFETAIMLEILEHTDDLKILSFIPKGRDIILTVPDFDHDSHVRHFNLMHDVIFRYEDYMTITHREKYGSWYILKGEKK